MKIVIIDSPKDVKNIYREFPYPMELISEDSEYLTVINHGQTEKILKSNYSFTILQCSAKEYKKIK